jgi:transposase
MSTTPSSALPTEHLQVIPAGALPVIKAFLDELGVIETINALAPNETAEYGYGGVAGVVIASRLQGVPLPIYAISEWAGETAVPAVFDIPAEKLNDDRIGEMLDALRPQRVALWGRVMSRAVQRFGIDVKTLHADPTKIAFEGSYAGWEALPAEVPRITYGKPKDGQVDRKLMSVSALVSEEGGLPTWFGLGDGNQADDVTYLQDLRELRAYLPLTGPLVIAGDSKLPSRTNLGQLCQWDYQFVATEPWRAARRERLTKLLRRGARWQRLDYVAEADRRKPPAAHGQYAGIVDTDELTDPATGERYPVRRLYIRSSRKAEQAQTKRQRQVAVIQAEVERIQGLLNKYDYTTLQTVRERVAKALRRNPAGRYFSVQVTKTRAQVAPLRLTWTLNHTRLRADAQWDGVYSVLTNLPEATHPASAVLEIYKDQHQVEGRFRDLNQLPVRVRPLWLKRPDRLETLVFLIMLAVLVLALIERQVRRAIAQTGQKIIGLMPEQRDTTTPKGSRLLKAFASLSVVKIAQGHRVRYLLSELSSVQRQILQALGLAELSTYLAGLAPRVQPSTAAVTG